MTSEADAADTRTHTEPASGRVAESVRREVDSLQREGIDVHYADPAPRLRLPQATQELVDQVLVRETVRPDFTSWLFNPEVHPAGNAWWGVSKRAVALHTLHQIGDIDRPAEGIDRKVYGEPLFEHNSTSARQLLIRERGMSSAARILSRYEAFIAAPSVVDGQDEYGLTSYDYLAGVLDSHAIRTRADVAVTLLGEHLERIPRSSLSIVSLACAAAEPLLTLAQSTLRGTAVEQLTFVDHDPLALASVVSLGKARGMSDRITIHRKNLLKTPPIQYLAPESIDVVDLLGIFEHLPATRFGYRLASGVLAAAAEVVRPGGVILLGNMLAERPQQDFFSAVWPALQQRTVRQTLSLVREAGFDPAAVRVRIPAREGIYAVYAVQKPLAKRSGKQLKSIRSSRIQQGLGRLLTSRMPEY
ncbi:methyltransferase domain-containing protein [Nesterenkonia ebinurensis]|uniref:class I SAM-dependent methyltransferase n=1 Tax=Nesterenkonia ebinurensis TaxID=2608252 RepID=UPI00123E43C3|nr:class I SAM-dependent methyltransferase [Nesterenkonia ebinurensis]